MAYTFTTRFGAHYHVRDGRVTRTADHGVIGIADLPLVLTITKMSAAPKVGHQVQFITREVGPILTSRVIAITPCPDRQLNDGWGHRVFAASDVLAWYSAASGVRLPVVTSTCWFCGEPVALDRQDRYTVSRIDGDSKYGYEPCHHHCGD